jgi:hypothetical protein
MIDSDKRAFQEMMVGVGELYSKPVSKPLLTIYFAALAPYTLDQVAHGLGKHSADTTHGTYMPKPADIIRQIELGKPNAEQRAELAWMTIEREISRTGAYGSLKIDDQQALAAVKSIGSWKDLCHTDIDKLAWKRKEFIAAYTNFENTPIDALPNHLAGMIEQSRVNKVEPIKLLAELKAKMELSNGNS